MARPCPASGPGIRMPTDERRGWPRKNYWSSRLPPLHADGRFSRHPVDPRLSVLVGAAIHPWRGVRGGDRRISR